MQRALLSYLTADDARRRQLRESLPDVFTDEVVEALLEAEASMIDARAMADDALRSGEIILSNAVPRAPTFKEQEEVADACLEAADLAGMGTKDADPFMTAGLDKEQQLLLFTNTLAQLLESSGSKVPDDLDLTSLAPPQPAAAHRAPVSNESTPEEAASARLSDRGCIVTKPLPPHLMHSVLEFLPIVDIFSITEHVCVGWNDLTTNSAAAQALWVGCLCREFPARIAALLAAEGGAMMDANWRTVAAVILTDDMADEGAEEPAQFSPSE